MKALLLQMHCESGRMWFALALCFCLLASPAVADELNQIPSSAPQMQGEDQQEGHVAKSSRLIKDAFFNIDDDLKGIAMYPFDHPLNSMLFLGGIGGLVAVDKPVTRYYQDKVEPIFKGYTITTPKLGKNLGLNGTDSYLVLGVAGSYLAGALFNDEKSQKAALLAGKATIYSILVSQLVLKSITGRMRPDPSLRTATADVAPYTRNPYDFGNWHSPTLGSSSAGTSMPSYHFTEYFAVARVYSIVYDNYFIPYGVAAALLTANIQGHHHWVSDMVAGALIGTMIGTVVADNAEDLPSKSAYLVVPTVSSQEVALNVYHNF
jgi:PAP2 superfamily